MTPLHPAHTELLGALALAVAGPAWAGRSLSYEDALAAAISANPTLQAAQLAHEQAEADVDAALGGYDPTLSLSGGYDQSRSLQTIPGFAEAIDIDTQRWNFGSTLSARAPTGTTASVDGRLNEGVSEFVDFTTGGLRDQVSTTPSFTLSLSQELLKGIHLGYNLQNVRRSQEGLTLAELELERTRQQALADTAQAYWAWHYQAQLAAIAHDSVETAKEALRVGVARVEAGEAAPVERTRLEAALVQAQSAAIDADNAAAQAADALLMLMGEAPGTDVEPASEPGEVPVLDLDAAAAVDVALSQSVELASARAQVEAAQQGLRDARHEIWPTLTASVNGGWSGGAFLQRDAEENGVPASLRRESLQQLGSFPFVSVNGTFSMPLGMRAARGAARRAALELEVRRSRVRELERSVGAQVAQQVRVLRSARQKVQLADINLRLAEETLSAEEALYDAGRTLLQDVLEARNEVDRTRAEAVKARTDYRLAEVELRRLQGQLDL